MKRALFLMVLVAACGGGGSGTGDDHVGDDDAGPGIDAAPGPPEPIHYIGRFDMTDPNAPVFEWSGSAVWAHFTGTTISATLGGSPNNFVVTIDGQAQPDVIHPGDEHSYVLASGLADGEHEVRLTRRTEAFDYDNTFKGFSGATLVDTPRPTRFVEIIGDSITCGYGVDGPDENHCDLPTFENETHAWGGLAADQLGITHASICWSGIGVYRNAGQDDPPHMPDVYGYVLPAQMQALYDFHTQPQVVVINLGTNDFSAGDPGQNYVDAMKAFVATVRSKNPDAWIVLATSPMLGGTEHTTEKGYLDQVQATDTHSVVLDLDEQNTNGTDGFGCDYHPSKITAQKMADKLKAELHDLEGW
jgi:lysophospholipase L1-like esterase